MVSREKARVSCKTRGLRIGPKTTKVNGVITPTGNAVKNVKLLAVATGEYTREELNKDATLGWTKKAQELIDADKALMNQQNNG